MRTDRTHACAYCRLRFPPSRRCPRCRDDKHVVDLTTKEAHDLLALREARIRRGRWLFSGGVASLAVAGSTWTMFGAPGTSELFLFVAAGFLLAAVLQGGWGFVRELSIRDPEMPRAGDTIEGRVVADTTVEAPGTHAAVVGYRLVGDSSRGPVDDAVVAPFALETVDGRRVQVDPEHALLDVPVERIDGPIDREVVFRWGGDPTDRRWKLGMLAAGATISVEGVARNGVVAGTVRQPIRLRAGGPLQKRS